MKHILAFLIGIFLLVVGSIIYIGESNSYKYEPRNFWDIPRVKIIYWIIELGPH